MDNKLLRYPVPFENELLSNYFYRLAEENCCSKESLGVLLKIPSLVLKVKELNFLNERYISKIAEVTKNDFRTIYNLTLKRFVLSNQNNYVQEERSSICPMCLKQKYYERIQWKNNLIKVCLEHRMMLTERCPYCNNLITSTTIQNRTCDCGVKLVEIESVQCDSNQLATNQIKLYSKFDIANNCNYNTGEELYNLLSDSEYIMLFSQFMNISKKYSIKIDLHTNIFSKKEVVSEIEDIYFAEWIISTWPYNVDILLDYMNKMENVIFEEENSDLRDYGLENCNADYLQGKFRRAFSPIDCLSNFMLFSLARSYVGIEKPLSKYFFDNFNVDYFRGRLRNILYLNQYVELYYATKIFFGNIESDREPNICEDELKLFFNVHEKCNKQFVLLEDLINFYQNIFVQGNLINNEECKIYHSVDCFIESFGKYNFKYVDLIQIILNGNIKFRIDPIHHRYGLQVIRLPLDRTEREIVQHLYRNINKGCSQHFRQNP